MRHSWYSAAITAWLASSLVLCEPFTPIHEAGRCAIRGSCGKSGWFGPELPCPDNGLAKDPTDEVRKQLVGICGSKWSTGPVCCEGEQVLSSNPLKCIYSDYICSLILSLKTSRKQMRSYHPALPARTTSTTYSAPLPALLTSPCS